jgi:hypothetical protein
VFTNIEEWRETTNRNNQITYDEKFDKLLKAKNMKLQRDFTDDNKRVVRKISAD